MNRPNDGPSNPWSGGIIALIPFRDKWHEVGAVQCRLRRTPVDSVAALAVEAMHSVEILHLVLFEFTSAVHAQLGVSVVVLCHVVHLITTGMNGNTRCSRTTPCTS